MHRDTDTDRDAVILEALDAMREGETKPTALELANGRTLHCSPPVVGPKGHVRLRVEENSGVMSAALECSASALVVLLLRTGVLS